MTHRKRPRNVGNPTKPGNRADRPRRLSLDPTTRRNMTGLTNALTTITIILGSLLGVLTLATGTARFFTRSRNR